MSGLTPEELAEMHENWRGGDDETCELVAALRDALAIEKAGRLTWEERAKELSDALTAAQARASKAEEAAIASTMRQIGRAIADHRLVNPMNGDGSNYTLGLLLASLHSEAADESHQERMAEREAELLAYTKQLRERRL